MTSLEAVLEGTLPEESQLTVVWLGCLQVLAWPEECSLVANDQLHLEHHQSDAWRVILTLIAGHAETVVSFERLDLSLMEFASF